MKFKTLRKKLHAFWKRDAIAICLVTALTCVALVNSVQANALYILTGVDDDAIVLDGTSDVTDVSSKLIYLGTGSGGYEITLVSGQTISICYGGATITIQAQAAETISALLARLHMDLEPSDIIAVDLSGEGAALTIGAEISYEERMVEAVAYETVRVANPLLAQGVEQVTQAGSNGVRTALYTVTWSDGKEISRQFVKELDTTAVPEIVEFGTVATSVAASDRISDVSKNADGSGTLKFASGASMSFSKEKTMTGTAYTAGSGGADTCTATGTFARVGVVAVDRKVIPLGTRMYIVSNDGKVVYGMAVAEDTGVRGNVVDLYHDTYRQCIEFGRRDCTVYILD